MTLTAQIPTAKIQHLAQFAAHQEKSKMQSAWITTQIWEWAIATIVKKGL